MIPEILHPVEVLEFVDRKQVAYDARDSIGSSSNLNISTMNRWAKGTYASLV